MVSRRWPSRAGRGRQRRGRLALLCPGLNLEFGTNPWGPNYTSCQLEDEHSGSGSREAMAGRTSCRQVLTRGPCTSGCAVRKPTEVSNQTFSEFNVAVSEFSIFRELPAKSCALLSPLGGGLLIYFLHRAWGRPVGKDTGSAG